MSVDKEIAFHVEAVEQYFAATFYKDASIKIYRDDDHIVASHDEPTSWTEINNCLFVRNTNGKVEKAPQHYQDVYQNYVMDKLLTGDL